MAAPLLILAILIKGSDKSLSYSINRSARELLYIPVSPDQKYKAMVFIDMFVDRFSKGIGGAVLVVIVFLLGIKDPKALIRLVSLLSVILIFGWMVLTSRGSREYIDSVKQKLSRRWDRADQVVDEKLNLDFAKLIFDTIESMGQSPNLYAMHLFDLLKQGKLTPELKKFLSCKSKEMAPVSCEVFFESDPTAVIQANEAYLDQDELKKEIREIMSLDAYQQVMKKYVKRVLSDTSPEGVIAKMEVAKGIGFLEADSPLLESFPFLLEDDSAEVRRYAVESAGRLKKKEYVPALIRLLPDPRFQGDAVAALEKYGADITGNLAHHLSDPDENVQVRKAAASILGRIGNQEATDSLLGLLAEDREEMMDTDLIDALDRIRSERPDNLFSPEIIKKMIRKSFSEFE